jgi:glucosamine--fructose-6-phosphate aminotransferase (isomerizing)
VNDESGESGMRKRAGKLSVTRDDLEWHPLAVFHDGIIENFAGLFSEGDEFRSKTCTAVAAVLLGRAYAASHDLVAAFRAVRALATPFE